MKKMIASMLIVFTCTSFIYSQRDNTLFNKRISMTGAWAGSGISFTKMANQTTAQFESGVLLEYNNTLLLGYEWRSNLNELQLPSAIDNPTFKFGYSSYLIGYNYKTEKIFHPNFTIGIGPGFLKVNGDRDQVLVVQPSIGFEINLLQWARLGIEGSYRHVTNTRTNGIENRDLSGFSGSVGLRFGWSW